MFLCNSKAGQKLPLQKTFEENFMLPQVAKKGTVYKQPCIISSRAKRACIAQASQGQLDFLLAINLSSLVGVRLDVIQSSDVKAHYGFPGNRLPSTTKLWDLFMNTGFFICELRQYMFTVGESPPNISGK